MREQGTQGQENPQKQAEPQVLSRVLPYHLVSFNGQRNAGSIAYPGESITHFI